MSILDANGSIACAECGRKARDERDKLLDGFHAMQQLYEDELKHALAENAKLRELVSDLMPVVCDGCHERLCDMPKEEHPFVECLFADRMRELGVEVDE